MWQTSMSDPCQQHAWGFHEYILVLKYYLLDMIISPGSLAGRSHTILTGHLSNIVMIQTPFRASTKASTSIGLSQYRSLAISFLLKALGRSMLPRITVLTSRSNECINSRYPLPMKRPKLPPKLTPSQRVAPWSSTYNADFLRFPTGENDCIRPQVKGGPEM